MKKLVPNGTVLIPADAVCTYEGVLFDAYQWQQEMFDGSHRTFENLRRADTVVVFVCIDDQLVLLRDEQPHVGVRMRAPAGRVDYRDASTLNAAKREVKEETGLEFSEWKLIGISKPATKIEHFIYRYVASGLLSEGTQKVDENGERIELLRESFENAKLMLDTEELIFEHGFLSDFSSIDELLAAPEFEGTLVDIPTKVEK